MLKRIQLPASLLGCSLLASRTATVGKQKANLLVGINQVRWASSCCGGKHKLKSGDESTTTSSNSDSNNSNPIINNNSVNNSINHQNSNNCSVEGIQQLVKPLETKSKLSAWDLKFWKCKHSWKRASLNTLNCLIGCSIGDFSMMWFLTSQYPELGMAMIMPICMASGIATSLALETALLRYREKFDTTVEAFRMACKMSFFSMLTMELSENITDYGMMTYLGLLNGNGCNSMLQVNEPAFWVSLAASLSMGYLVPLPYNYYQLKKHGKSCH